MKIEFDTTENFLKQASPAVKQKIWSRLILFNSKAKLSAPSQEFLLALTRNQVKLPCNSGKIFFEVLHNSDMIAGCKLSRADWLKSMGI